MRNGRVSYALARRSMLRQIAGGRLSRYEACDAHPDLLRAANYCGEATSDPCPVCERGPLVLVTYAFSDEFSKNEQGKTWVSKDVTPLLAYREVHLYTVEVCRDCSWNHLRSQNVVGNGKVERKPVQRRASK